MTDGGQPDHDAHGKTSMHGHPTANNRETVPPPLLLQRPVRLAVATGLAQHLLLQLSEGRWQFHAVPFEADDARQTSCRYGMAEAFAQMNTE